MPCRIHCQTNVTTSAVLSSAGHLSPPEDRSAPLRKDLLVLDSRTRGLQGSLFQLLSPSCLKLSSLPAYPSQFLPTAPVQHCVRTLFLWSLASEQHWYG